MRRNKNALVTAATVLAMVAAGYTQEWRGMGRMAGKVTDESGAPLEGVTVKIAFVGSNGGTASKSNKNGEWAIGGIATGNWAVDLEKQGYKSRKITVNVANSGNKPIDIILRKAAPTVDPNAEIRQELQKAADLMAQKNYAGARGMYEQLLAKYPTAYQLEPLIARAYYGEKQLDKAIEHLRLALAKDPDNFEVKLLLGNVLIEGGNADEGKQILASLDETKVKDPIVFVNIGIALINQNKATEALPYFEKAIARFPDSPDASYYRGITHLQAGKNEEAKADLTKFVAMAPDAAEAPMATKILEQLK